MKTGNPGEHLQKIIFMYIPLHLLHILYFSSFVYKLSVGSILHNWH